MGVRESLPKIIIHVSVAILIWIFGNLVFIPISRGIFIEAYSVTQIISIIIIVGIAIAILRVTKHLRDLSDAAAGYISHELGVRKGEVTVEELHSYRSAFRGVLYIILVALAFLLFAQNLSILHPALTAVVLIGVAIWTVATLFNVGRALSRQIENYAKQWATDLERRLS